MIQTIYVATKMLTYCVLDEEFSSSVGAVCAVQCIDWGLASCHKSHRTRRSQGFPAKTPPRDVTPASMWTPSASFIWSGWRLVHDGRQQGLPCTAHNNNIQWWQMHHHIPLAVYHCESLSLQVILPVQTAELLDFLMPVIFSCRFSLLLLCKCCGSNHSCQRGVLGTRKRDLSDAFQWMHMLHEWFQSVRAHHDVCLSLLPQERLWQHKKEKQNTRQRNCQKEQRFWLVCVFLCLDPSWVGEMDHHELHFWLSCWWHGCCTACGCMPCSLPCAFLARTHPPQGTFSLSCLQTVASLLWESAHSAKNHHPSTLAITCLDHIMEQQTEVPITMETTRGMRSQNFCPQQESNGCRLFSAPLPRKKCFTDMDHGTHDVPEIFLLRTCSSMCGQDSPHAPFGFWNMCVCVSFDPSFKRMEHFGVSKSLGEAHHISHVQRTTTRKLQQDKQTTQTHALIVTNALQVCHVQSSLALLPLLCSLLHCCFLWKCHGLTFAAFHGGAVSVSVVNFSNTAVAIHCIVLCNACMSHTTHTVVDSVRHEAQNFFCKQRNIGPCLGIVHQEDCGIAHVPFVSLKLGLVQPCWHCQSKHSQMQHEHGHTHAENASSTTTFLKWWNISHDMLCGSNLSLAFSLIVCSLMRTQGQVVTQKKERNRSKLKNQKF